VCFAGPDTVFAVYSDDERQGETIGTRYGVEKGVRYVGLGICSHCIRN